MALTKQITFVPDPIERTDVVMHEGNAEKNITAVQTANKGRKKKFKYDPDCFDPSKKSSFRSGAYNMTQINKDS